MDDFKLTNVILHITDACTSNCPYCYACASEKTFKHADINKIYQIIDKLAEASIERVSLLGGDPALHPHIIDIAKRLREKGILAGIMSNTMDLPVPAEESIKYIDNYETTIHGINAIEHDTFSNKHGAYDFLMHKLRVLSNYPITIGIAINIIPETSDKIYDMVKSLIVRERIRVDYIILQRIVPFGRAHNSTHYLLSKDNLEQAMHEVEKVNTKLGIRISVEDPFPLCVLDEHYHKYMHPCEWGYTKAALNGDGDLTRCGADPRYLLGNIFETPIQTIWKNSPLLKDFRSKKYLPNSCRKCSLFSQCGGGCSLSNQPNCDVGIDYLIRQYGRKS